jgi:HD-like signal output (HDOD) protein
MISADDIKKVIKLEISRRIRNDEIDVPMLPHVASKVMALASNPNVSIKELTALIEHDQHISAKILNIANSPVYKGLHDITNLNRAILTIGLRSVTDLIFSLSVGSKVFRNKEFQGRMNKLWQHSVGTAFVSQEIAKMRRKEMENAFLYGLMHDIGKTLVIDTITKLVKRAPDKLSLVFINEYLLDEILDSYHCQVGGLVARKWRFPTNLTSAIVFHHDPLNVDKPRPEALHTSVANLFAHKLGLGVEASGMDLAAHPHVKNFGLTSEEVSKLEKELTGPAIIFINQFM